MTEQFLQFGGDLSGVQSKSSLFGDEHDRGGSGPERPVCPNELAHQPSHAVTRHGLTQPSRGAKAELGLAQQRIVSIENEMLALPSCSPLHSLSNKSLVRQTHTPVETVIFRRKPSVFSDRGGVCGSVPSGRPWWPSVSESRDRSYAYGWKVGMFSSCYS